MNLLVPYRRFDPNTPEMIDRPDNDPDVLQDDLKNLQTINRYFGGYRAIRTAIVPLIAQVDKSRPVEVLDLATGSGDHPVKLAKLGQTINRSVRITAMDKNPEMVKIAQELTSGFPSITIERGDISSPAYPDKSFDIVLCSLVLHHFSHEDAVGILRHLARLSRIGFIVNDLNRTFVGAWTTWLFTHIAMRNPMTLHDSYASVMRAFTPKELSSMAKKAGVHHFQIMTRPFFRLIMIGTH
jgi:ubiquinone/menaquinone biosynthesis C-methylase UbiE